MANLSPQVWQFHPFVKWQGTGDDLTWTSSSLGPCSLLPHWLLGSFQPPELQACEELERGESHSASSRVWRVRSELAWRQNIPRLHHIKKDGEACPHLRLNCWCQDDAPGLSLQLSDITRAPCPVTRASGPAPYLCRRLLCRSILRKPVGSVTELSCLFISSNCCSMMSPASLSVSLLAQALWTNTREPSGKDTLLWGRLTPPTVWLTCACSLHTAVNCTDGAMDQQCAPQHSARAQWSGHSSRAVWQGDNPSTGGAVVHSRDIC